MPIDDLEGHARFQGFGVPIGGGDLGGIICTKRTNGQDGERPFQDVARCDHRGAATAERAERVGAAGATRADRSRIGAASEARHKEAERDRARKVGTNGGD
jgi:hypothetical protein